MKLIEKLSEIPDLDKDKFWDDVDNDRNKSLHIFMIIDLLRSIQPAMLNDSETRSVLAELKAFQRMFDFKLTVKNKKERAEENSNQDDIPVDPTYGS